MVTQRGLLRQAIVPGFAAMLRTLPTHRMRKKFAKIFGPFFRGTVAQTAYGFEMICDWYDNANRAVFEGSYGVVAAFIRELPPNSIFVDIGANQGGTSLLAAQVVGKSGRVVAYEPNPVSAERMRENIAISGVKNVTLIERGVASREDLLLLDVTDIENSGAAHVSDQGSPFSTGPISLHDLGISSDSADIFIKIDTEGYEYEVLQGLSQLLDSKQVRQIIVEIDEANLKRFGSSSRAVYQFLEKFGFSPRTGLSSGHYDEVFSAS